MSVPVAAEKLETARRMLDEGASQREVARALGMGRQTVRKYFPGKIRLPAKSLDYDAIARLHQSGLSAAAIATQVGCNPRSVQRWRVAKGVSEPPRENAYHPVAPERLAAARALLDDGASRMDAARTLHMTRETLQRHLPDRVWTPEQSSRYALMVKRLNRLEAFV